MRNGDPLSGEMAVQPFKGDGGEVSGEIKRKYQGNVSKYCTVKAIVKLMRRTSLLCRKLVEGEEIKGSQERQQED